MAHMGNKSCPVFLAQQSEIPLKPIVNLSEQSARVPE